MKSRTTIHGTADGRRWPPTKPEKPGRKQRGLNREVIRSFARRINDSDESGTLFPQAPISAVPRRFFRDQADSSDPVVLNQFKRHIVEFLVSNRRTIQASRVLVNFHVSSDPVPFHYLNATADVFRYMGPYSLVTDVVIYP